MQLIFILSVSILAVICFSSKHGLFFPVTLTCATSKSQYTNQVVFCHSLLPLPSSIRPLTNVSKTSYNFTKRRPRKRITIPAALHEISNLVWTSNWNIRSLAVLHSGRNFYSKRVLDERNITRPNLPKNNSVTKTTQLLH